MWSRAMWACGLAVAVVVVAGCGRRGGSRVEIVEEAPPSTSVDVLIEACGDADPDVRFYAVLTLATMGEKAKPAVPALTKALRDPNVQGRSSAADALGRIGPGAEPAAEALGQALKDGSEEVRLAAVDALGKIGPSARGAVAALLKATPDDTPILRDRILWATDYPLIEWQRSLDQVMELPIRPQTRENLLYGNAARLLGLP